MNAEASLKEHRRIALLLADRAINPLLEPEVEELEALLARHPDIDDTELDEAAAAVHLMKPVLPESMPETLRARVFAGARNFFSAQGYAEAANVVASAPVAAMPKADAEPHTASVLRIAAHTATASSEKTSQAVAEIIPFPGSSQPAQRVSHWSARIGWLVAAACLALVLFGGWKLREQQKQIAALTAPQPAPDYAALRLALIGRDEKAVLIKWAAGTYPGLQKVTGDVLWSDAAQQGYLRFINMPANDPEKLVYQLWIFASNQEEAYPIDGGVFNVSSNGEIIIPINAKLFVNKPSLFAITIEKPGGVVVSKRDKLVLLAKVG